MLDILATDPDDCVDQSEVMEKIIATSLLDWNSIDAFNNKLISPLKLAELKRYYEEQDISVVNLLLQRHIIHIDDKFILKPGAGQINMYTDKTALDYTLTVGNCIGFGALLSNTASLHQFIFEMDLKKPIYMFKGKHVMIRFDMKGKMLYLGQASNEDMFLTMALNSFLARNISISPPGHSMGAPTMSMRHYHQVVLMVIYFLGLIPECGYDNEPNDWRYSVDLDGAHVNWELFTNTWYVFA